MPLVAGAAAIAVVAGTLAINSVLGGRDEQQPTGAAVTGLRADVKGIRVDLSWAPYPGADSYRLYRDPRTAGQTVSVVTGTRATDRPGDDAEHTYSVVALDGDEVAGPPAPLVRATAKAPYRGAQPIASAWPALIPEKQGRRGPQGQKCRTQDLVSPYSNGEIRCVYPNGVLVQVLGFDAVDVRERRARRLAAEPGVTQRPWQTQGYSGRLLGTDRPQERTRWPWRFWTYDQEPTFAIYATWPHHRGTQLESWWKKRAPFR
jgi:hypothetical protein